MALEYRTPDWDKYRMDYNAPWKTLEPEPQEVAAADGALRMLVEAGALPHARYDGAKLRAMQAAVQKHFEIPWTAITPRMQRFIYAVNAIHQPRTMVAAGIFCGNTFISNAGAGAGPGACYSPKQLIGVEIKPEEAVRAERNVRKVDPTGVARIVADDAVHFVKTLGEPVNLLYLDADGTDSRGKGVYLDILNACYDRMPKGSLVLAHNSVNCAGKLHEYLEFVRDAKHFRASVNVIFDPEGLEFSAK